MEKANINTPMGLAINNEIDRYTLAIDVIDRTPKLQRIGAHAKEKCRDLQIDCCNFPVRKCSSEVASYHQVGRSDIGLHIEQTTTVRGYRNSTVHRRGLHWQTHHASDSAARKRE